jgi:hypothetical protein
MRSYILKFLPEEKEISRMGKKKQKGGKHNEEGHSIICRHFVFCQFYHGSVRSQQGGTSSPKRGS